MRLGADGASHFVGKRQTGDYVPKPSNSMLCQYVAWPLIPLRRRFDVSCARALAVTHQLTVDHGWDWVRLSEVAALTGVSRPTLYKEFGDKQGLGQALVLRETERFLVGVAAQLERHPQDLTAGIRAAVSFTLIEAEASPLLRAVLTSARGDDTLLPALTTRSAPVLEAATTMLGAWLGEQLPGLNPA
jgi:AcrR family transcriptional regulator